MAYKVLQSFRDAQTRVVYRPGNEYPSEVPADRIEKLTKLAFIKGEAVENLEEKPEKLSESNTVAEIKAVLDEKGITYQSTATKAELLALLEG
jgi:hypothetical protein